MFNHWMEIVHNHDNGYLDWLFHKSILRPRESNSILPGKGERDSHLRNYLEVHSLNFGNSSEFSGWTC